MGAADAMANVNGDACEPGAELVGLAELCEMHQCLQSSFLERVFDEVGVLQQAAAHADRKRSVAQEQCCRCLAIARSGGADKLRIGQLVWAFGDHGSILNSAARAWTGYPLVPNTARCRLAPRIL